MSDSSNKRSELYQTFGLIAFLVILYSDAFSGVIRFALSSMGLSILIYAPFFVGLACWIAFVISNYISTRNKYYLLITFLAIFSMLLSLELGRSPFEVGFGFWAWIPFLVGVMAAGSVNYSKIFKHMLAVLAIAAIGVFLNDITPLPWTGKSYQVFGATIDTTREWDAYGIKRLSGFGRISDIVAGQITIGCYLALHYRVKFLHKVFIWLASVFCVYLTTSKTPLAAVAVAPLFAGASHLVKISIRGGGLKLPYIYFIGTTLVLVLLVVVPPLMSEQIVSGMDAQAGSGFLRARSFFDRAYFMWPASLDLVNRDANALQPWLGRGLGGIGAPLFRTTGLVITGDNMFVSLYVNFGVASALFALPLLGGYGSLLKNNLDAAFAIFGISCALLIMATTNVTIEAPYLCLCFGLLVGKFFNAQIGEVKLRSSMPGSVALRQRGRGALVGGGFSK